MIMLDRLWMFPPAAALALALGVGIAAAQTTMTPQSQQSTHVQGEISGIDANRLTIKTREGETRLRLAPDARILTLSPSNAEAVALESFIGTAGIAEKEERVRAKVVVIYPQGSTGEANDYLTWDLTPESTMRQGIVRSVETGLDGRVVALSYPQGGSTVLIPPDASVMLAKQADQKMLRKGVHIFVPSVKTGQDGSMTADMVAIGERGFNPPLPTR
jgi:hypothetical protein